MMNDQARKPRTVAPGAQNQTVRSPTLAVVARSMVATLLLACVVGSATYLVSKGIATHGDDVSPSDEHARLEAFRALAPLKLTTVEDSDIDSALQSMHLDPAAAAALKADLSDATSPPQHASEQQVPSGAQQPTPQSAPARTQSRRLRLVWITLWDTDVEDGDVVRIDSEGYSRTVRLTKKGDTFAVPVPADGVIKVTGVSDGDGGGITVGLASGDARAIFPIMSEGQELGLKVRLN
jgi:hypothetical protein